VIRPREDTHETVQFAGVARDRPRAWRFGRSHRTRRLRGAGSSRTFTYGSASSQGVDLFLPRGKGPFPIAILIHGGCWRDLPGAGREQFRHLGADLAAAGIAVWSIGYRRADEPGGGYPGTFHDVAASVERLRVEAPRLNLDLERSVLVGHSAGGHLALWMAASDRMAMGSPLRGQRPFVPRSVISLGGVGDLETFSPLVPVHCGPGIIERLVPSGANPYADISPAMLPRPPGRVVMVSGVLDRLTPPFVAHDYARAMHAKGEAPVELVNIPGAGHFDLVTPGTRAWADVKSLIVETLNASQRPSNRAVER
jgi:acetyl esterase/lipase